MTKGWKGESNNHSLCAKGIKVRSNRPVKKFTKNPSIEVKWDGGSKNISLEDVSRENIEKEINDDAELRKELVENEKPFRLYAKGKELII